MSETPLIEFRGIGKRYGTGEAAFVALHHIDLQIQQRRICRHYGAVRLGQVDSDEYRWRT